MFCKALCVTHTFYSRSVGHRLGNYTLLGALQGPGTARLLPLQASQWGTAPPSSPVPRRVWVSWQQTGWTLMSFPSCFCISVPPGAGARLQPLTSGPDFSEHGVEEDLFAVPGGQSRRAPVVCAPCWPLDAISEGAGAVSDQQLAPGPAISHQTHRQRYSFFLEDLRFFPKGCAALSEGLRPLVLPAQRWSDSGH